MLRESDDYICNENDVDLVIMYKQDDVTSSSLNSVYDKSFIIIFIIFVVVMVVFLIITITSSSITWVSIKSLIQKILF